MSNARRNDPAANAVEDYTRLLSLAAHEFRTPVSVVAGYLRMLQKDTESPLPERQRHMVDEAMKSCERLAALLAEMSDIAKLDTGRWPAQAEAFDLFVDLEKAASTARHGEDRDIRLQLTGLDSGAPLLGERYRLSAAFSALLRAVMREQPAAVTIVCERRLVTAEGSTSAVVVIARESDVQRAFEAAVRPFDDTRSGVGLGLQVARRVIERAGGHLAAPTATDETDTGLRSAAVVSIPVSV